MMVLVAGMLVVVLAWRLYELEMRVSAFKGQTEVIQEDMRAMLGLMTRLSERGRGPRARSEKGSEGSSVERRVMQWRREPGRVSEELQLAVTVGCIKAEPV